MNNKEIEIQKALGTYLSAKWEERNKLQMKAGKLWVEGRKLKVEGDKLHTAGDELLAEANKLQVDADELYINAAIEAYGPDVRINWRDGSVEIND